MPIIPFLSGQAFEPELLRNMSAAFEGVCDALGLVARRDPATELVAKKIVELAQRGVRDAATLRKMTLEEFNLRDG